MWQVAESAWQVRLPLPSVQAGVNVFVVRDRNGYELVDTAIWSGDCLMGLQTSLESLGVSWPSIREILFSHFHPDHLGAAAEIRRRSGTPVRMPCREAELVRPPGPKRKFLGEATEFLVEHGMPRTG